MKELNKMNSKNSLHVKNTSVKIKYEIVIKIIKSFK